MTIVKISGKDRAPRYILAQNGRVVGGHPAYRDMPLEEAICALTAVLRRPDHPEGEDYPLVERAEVDL